MIDLIKKKILEIEAKVSNNINLDLSVRDNLEDNNSIPSIKRHSMLYTSNTQKAIDSVVSEISVLEMLVKDINKLAGTYYNSKEYQLNTLKQRYDLLKIRKEGLLSLDLGIKKIDFMLNDKRLLLAGNEYEFYDNGITFRAKSITKVIPVSFSIGSDSNVVVGSRSNRLTNSNPDSLFSINPNDIFSVHRRDTSDLEIYFDFKFTRSKEIINEIKLKFLEKPKQDIYIEIYDVRTEELIFSGNLYGERIILKKPVMTSQLEMYIKSKGIQENELSILEIAFFKKRYLSNLENNKTGLEVTTANLPSLSSKLLTLENFNLEYDNQKDFLDVRVKANNETLNSLASEEKLRGPYIDPSLHIECVLKNLDQLISYVGDKEYKKSTSFPSGNDYKIFQSYLTEDPYTISSSLQNRTTYSYDVPAPSIEDFLQVEANDKVSYRITDNSAVQENSYKIDFIRNRYRIETSQMQSASEIKITCTGTPTYIETIGNDQGIVFPWLGLGTDVSLEYPTAFQTSRTFVNTSDNKFINLNAKNICKLILSNGFGVVETAVEKPFGYPLSSNEYSCDYQNGVIEKGSEIEGTFVYDFVSTEVTSFTLSNQNYIQRLGRIKNNLKILDKKVKLSDSPFLHILSFHRKKILEDGKYTTNIKFDIDKGKIFFPSTISLVKGSILLQDLEESREEVAFYNGYDELNKQEENTVFYRYIGSEEKIHRYGGLASSISNLLNISIADPVFQTRKLDNSFLSEEGDYAFVGNFLYVYTGSITRPDTVGVTYKVTTTSNKFSVDYLNNIVYSNNLSEDTLLGFSYSFFKLKDFELAIEVEKRKELKNKEYIAIPSNTEELADLASYFTPIIKSLSIGIIG